MLVVALVGVSAEHLFEELELRGCWEDEEEEGWEDGEEMHRGGSLARWVDRCYVEVLVAIGL